MTTEQYQTGYEEGYQEGWNAAVDEGKAPQQDARFSEAQARKQDTELIRQMLEALDDGAEHTAQCITNYYNLQCDCGKAQAITAARTRLENT